MSERHRYFPEELLFQILTRLPVRSVVRFTAVSKSWFFLITSPAFVSAHLRHSRCKGNSTGNLHFLLQPFEKSLKTSEYVLLEESDPQTLTPISSPELPLGIASTFWCYRVVGCYSGVVCMSRLYSNLSDTYLWNPCIQKFKTLPPPTIIPNCFDTSVLGFGVNPHCAEDLKVVRAVFGRKLGSPDVEIYSLSTGKWRRLSANCVNLCKIDLTWSQTFAHEGIHWIGCKSLENERSKCCIIVFSLADELFSEIMLPDEFVNVTALNLSITTFDESIAVAKCGSGIHGPLCELWMMKEYGVVESWCRLYHIELVEGVQRIVGFRENGDLLIPTTDGELVSYCPDTEVINKLGICCSVPSFYVGKYLESLVLLQEHGCIFYGLSEEMTSMSI